MPIPSFIKKLPIPAFLFGGLVSSYDFPKQLEGSMSDFLAGVDFAAFTGPDQPTLFLIFVGLTLAWVIYSALSLFLWGRKRRALMRLSEFREEATHFLHDATSHRALTDSHRAEIQKYQKDIFKNVEIVSKHNAGRFRTLFGYDASLIPRPFHKFKETLELAEIIARVDDFLMSYK